MSSRHTYLEDPQQNKRYPLERDHLVIGRDSGCDLVLDSPSISRRHATLTRQGEVWQLVDDGSRNGTEVDGKRLQGEEAVALHAGARVRFGSIELVFCDASTPVSEAKKNQEKLRHTLEFQVDQFLPVRDAQEGNDAFESLLVELLFRAQSALFPTQPVENLLESLLHLTLAYVPAMRASVQLVRQNRDDGGDTNTNVGAPELENRLTVNNQGHELTTSRGFLISSAVAQKVLREKKAVLIRDVASDAEFHSRKSLLKAGVTSAIAAPIFDGNDILGILYADIQEGAQELTESDVGAVTVLASVAGASLMAANVITALMRSEAQLRQENQTLREQLAKVGA